MRKSTSGYDGRVKKYTELREEDQQLLTNYVKLLFAAFAMPDDSVEFFERATFLDECFSKGIAPEQLAAEIIANNRSTKRRAIDRNEFYSNAIAKIPEKIINGYAFSGMRTLLHVACINCHFLALPLLIAKGADFWARDENNQIPFDCFSNAGVPDIDRLQKQAFAAFMDRDPTQKIDAKGNTLLHIAFLWRDYNLIDYIYQKIQQFAESAYPEGRLRRDYITYAQNIANNDGKVPFDFHHFQFPKVDPKYLDPERYKDINQFVYTRLTEMGFLFLSQPERIATGYTLKRNNPEVVVMTSSPNLCSLIIEDYSPNINTPERNVATRDTKPIKGNLTNLILNNYSRETSTLPQVRFL